MAAPTVNDARAASLVRRIERLDSEPRREAVALGVVDALLDRDDATLATVVDALRDARAQTDGDRELEGWLDATIACAHWGLERVAAPAAVAEGTHAHAFLRALDGVAQLGSGELRDRLGIDETQVSRAGRRLLQAGLVTRRKVARQVFWQLTSRGRRALEEPGPRQPPGSDFWQEALRRGFDAAYGEQPGEPRKVDPTRERIIESTLDLHSSRGIQATTWAEIAEKAGVPAETLEALFPTRDDLIRSCAEHFLETLRLPPSDGAGAVFAGTGSQHDRIRRLVETSFGAYERGADGITVARRERKEVPTVDGSLSAVENSLEALVVEALRPERADRESVASMRALTDVEVWRALRDQGATPDGAVEKASAAVERWLAARR